MSGKAINSSYQFILWYTRYTGQVRQSRQDHLVCMLLDTIKWITIVAFQYIITNFNLNLDGIAKT